MNAILNALILAAFGWSIGWFMADYTKRKIKEAIEPLEEVITELELQVHFLGWLLSGRAGADREAEEELWEEVEDEDNQ